MAQKRRDDGNGARSSGTTETGHRGDQDESIELIHRIADEVMSVMATQIREHIGQADANVAANAAALAMAYSLAMMNPNESDVESFMASVTEETKGVVQAIAPTLEAARSLEEMDLDQDTLAKAAFSLANASGGSTTVN